MNNTVIYATRCNNKTVRQPGIAAAIIRPDKLSISISSPKTAV